FNGEIYNFAVLRRDLEAAGEVFTGHSDSEVLLHAMAKWGPACLERLEGMYAFAFLDVARTRLILARAPAGIQAVYIAELGDSLLFASEVRALLSSGLVRPRLNPCGVAGLLAYGAVQQPNTLFRDIRSLPPGSWLEVVALPGGGWIASKPRRFWSYPKAEDRRTEPDAA